jgi:hypothetical protein
MLRLVATRELISDIVEVWLFFLSQTSAKLYLGAWPQCEAFAARVERKARRLTAGEDKGIVMGLIGWDGVLG